MPRGKSIVYFIRRHKFKLLHQLHSFSLSLSLFATYALIDYIIVVSLVAAAAGYHYVYYGTPPPTPGG